MKPNNRKKCINQDGIALVEMALLLPVLLLILFGIAEFGRALYMENTLTNAAREGARLASTSTTDPLNVAALQSYVKGYIPFDQTGIVINITPTTLLKHGVDTVTVVVNLPFQSAVPLISQLSNVTLQGQASMLYE
ncbi:pilus assembly protein [Geomonas sp. Red32]|uniref:TadE/TadG family type IV pilus assembly protein n=1 Tax=Geomonas sp. Red32 TaxID=2912856 RepID=UPI00202CDC11|nr:TadE/TadG family type IV pilus assembly protein [Geomonas sp. Red32]MCM0083901.1 pilus assembly protein [Geomonas sp. Red32]